jgi:DNA-binding NarL/FixJ family response regulator
MNLPMALPATPRTQPKERIDMAARKASAHKAASKKRILVVDDHPMMREGLCGVIDREPDMMVCGEAENAQQAMNAVRKLEPDLALVDITLPGKSGLELVKDIKAIHPRVVVLAISMHDESLYAERMLRAGASGYITKQQPPEELIKAIRQVLDKHVYVSEEVSESFLRRFSCQPQADSSPMKLLTDREFEVMQLLGQGKSPKEIAAQLHLSAKTIAVHSANIRQKLKLKTTARLIRFAVQWEDLRNLTPES